MAYAQMIDGQPVEVAGQFTTGGFTYPASWADGADVEEVRRLGLYPIVEPGAPPADVKVVGQHLEVASGAVRREWTTEPYTLAEAKARQAAAATAVREAQQVGGATTSFGRVATDAKTQTWIGSATLGASIRTQQGQPFSIDFPLADGSMRTLDGPEMIQLGFEAMGHFTACQQVEAAIQARIAAAETVDEVFAVDVTAGYPA